MTLKIIALILVSLWASYAQAGELPWIGVSLNSPTVEQREEVSLKHGVGFLVGEVITGGPLAKAGGREGDLWWKFDGQILINKGQMVVLLRGKSAGDEVEVEFYREGRLQKVTLTLENRHRHNMVPVGMAPDRPSCSRVLAKRDQIARVTIGEKNLSLQNEGAKWRFMIEEDGAVVLSSLVGDQDLGDKIPAKWHGAFVILRQTLANSATPQGTPAKERVRYRAIPKSPTE